MPAHMVVLSQPSVARALFNLHLDSPLVAPAHQVIKKTPGHWLLCYKFYTKKQRLIEGFMARFLLHGGFICSISMSDGQCQCISRQNIPEWLLPLPPWLLLQKQCTDWADWTLQPRSDSPASPWEMISETELKVSFPRLYFSTELTPWNNMVYLSYTVNAEVFSVRCLTRLYTTGYFCSLGSTEPSPVSRPYGDVCPMGHFCPQGSGSPKPCPVGSFLPEPGASSPSHCPPCPPGKYCLSPGGSQPTGRRASPGFPLVEDKAPLESQLCKIYSFSCFSCTPTKRTSH